MKLKELRKLIREEIKDLKRFEDSLDDYEKGLGDIEQSEEDYDEFGELKKYMELEKGLDDYENYLYDEEGNYVGPEPEDLYGDVTISHGERKPHKRLDRYTESKRKRNG